MSTHVEIRQIESLTQLAMAMRRFAASTAAMIEQIQAELTSTQEWLAERERHWQLQVELRQQTLMSARSAYAACQADARNERYPPDCSHLAAAVHQAQAALAEASAQLANTQQWAARLNAVAARYSAQANHLKPLVREHVAESASFLSQKLADLAPYASGAGGAVAVPSTSMAEADTQSLSTPGHGSRSASPIHYTDQAGHFAVTDWTDYPSGPRPDGPFILLQGDAYESASDLKNQVNQTMHRTNPSLKGLDIHEIHPVKFGGSPTDPANKIVLPPTVHAKYTTWWNHLQRLLESG